ncbi:MAG: toxin-antitoxin system, antitoxin component, Xre family protein [Alphaproteobacteria bacterium]|nr:toxin-antitoxin system, antitoxin component, Xre family protein [Alphaproteobacteria bacterium]MDE2494472.1 toxin-antitoxin system, antitoxin component, Xre family protein [Alphaproteobacteria bacterium]
MSNPQSLFDKIKALPPDHISEVEDFVDFIAARAQDRALIRAAAVASAPAFAEIWNNPEDDAYNAL